MTKISILGCGWLGLPLAKALLQNNFLVSGSTTSEDKLKVLDQQGIKPFLIALSENKTTGNVTDFLENSEILIIDIPPKLRGSENENFVSKIRNIIPFIEKSVVTKVLFISSTSVYNDTATLVTEDTIPQPDTESGKQLLETEELLQTNINFKTTIVRFGGLIGKDRHPVKFLAGRANLANPEAPINLIHQEDCIGIIQKIIITNAWNETFNAVAPFHPSREKYYTQKAVDLNLPLPKFTSFTTSVGKIILGDRVETVLKYTFAKPNL
ncbi:Nucleoside-diphosphate-sugar epimerase [Flavobacterium fryxellicola]|uniref:NAD(P)-dependent oxidoreductase n=1 Tax=Flavobacterium fryxellicola TaxID=249352 RepID=A0A167XP15_9FLAO|nr:NAD(P)-dependent oxidoreductase [Flavobacterium fryxellicola]OAB28556.1 NAD(P)-dependent oxidoreductase [Flavobacterium fryxellicola]SHN52037.1 Nucleoside-diphosphate-sugar epimerase [Flavobacterium fryxellicola]